VSAEAETNGTGTPTPEHQLMAADHGVVRDLAAAFVHIHRLFASRRFMPNPTRTGCWRGSSSKKTLGTLQNRNIEAEASHRGDGRG
jgi:hypothetical protein